MAAWREAKAAAAAGRSPQGPTMCIVGPRYAAAGGMSQRRICNNLQPYLHVSNTGDRWYGDGILVTFKLSDYALNPSPGFANQWYFVLAIRRVTGSDPYCGRRWFDSLACSEDFPVIVMSS